MTETLLVPVPAATSYAVDARWSADLIIDGFTPVSTFFLENYHRLLPPITHAEAMFIIHLIRYKWSSSAPYPGFKTIAKQMGISTQMARNHARNLEQKKYLRREMQIGSTNRFHLEPLFIELSKLRKQQVKSSQASL